MFSVFFYLSLHLCGTVHIEFLELQCNWKTLCMFAEELSGIFVKSISEGSAADLCKKIQVNDRIVEVCRARLRRYFNGSFHIYFKSDIYN